MATFRQVVDALPAAVYVTDADGLVIHFNKACVRLSGREPAKERDRWCVTWRLYHPDGTPMPHDECPMAISLRQRCAISNAEIVVERPDGSRAWALASPSPLFDEQGELIGGVNMLVDITEQRAKDKALCRSEQELADYFNTASIGLHWVGPDGIVQRVNPAELALLGYTEDEYVGRHIADFHADADVIEDILARLARGERLHDYPARLRCKDGSIRDVLISSSVLFEDGEFIHTRCFTHDVTERKRAEDSIRRTATTLAMLVERSPLGIYTVNSDFRIAHVSEGAMPAFRNVQPVIGRDFAEVMHTIWPEPFASNAIDIFRHTLETGEPYISPGLTELRKDIRQLESYEWQVNRITLDDGKYGVVCYYFDSTRLQQATRALRESEARFRMLADNMSQLAWTCDTLCEMNWLNQRWLNYTGMTLEASTGSGWQRAHHPDHLDRVMEGKRRSQETGEIWEDTFPLRRHDGAYRWFLSRAVPIRDDKGNVVQWFGTNTDITEREEHEEQMRTVMAELNHRVKNSLAVIIAISQQTIRRASSLPEFARDFESRLGSIAKAHNLLTSTDWKGCSLDAIIHSEIDSRLAAPNQLSFESPMVMLTPKQALTMHMIIHELVTNATKHGALRDASGAIAIQGEITTRGAADYLRLKWQERSTERIPRPNEFGYGSQLITQSVELELNGKLSREYAPAGLRCEITIPLSDKAADENSTPSVQSQASQSEGDPELRVLVVEDNTTIGMAFVSELEARGFQVSGPARTINDARQSIENVHPAVALLDVDLNGTKVYPLAYQLRERKIPFALLTGYSVNDLPEDLQDANIFIKPVDLNEIEGFLKAYTQSRSSRTD